MEKVFGEVAAEVSKGWELSGDWFVGLLVMSGVFLRREHAAGPSDKLVRNAVRESQIAVTTKRCR